MTERQLTTIRRLDDVLPHENADRLELAVVGGWKVVVGKGQFAKGDLVIFCEIDTLLPPREEYDFLEKGSSWMSPTREHWYRLKTIRLRGELSQGLVLPVDILDTVAPLYRNMQTCGELVMPTDQEGFCLDGFLGVQKYEKPLPSDGTAKGNFPHFVPRTDETRVQNIRNYERDIAGHLFHVTEKLDGSSCTVYRKDDIVGVCSRNMELVETEGNRYWTAAKESGAVEIVTGAGPDIAIQGEVCGPSFQGNPYKLERDTLFVYKVWDIDEQSFLHSFALNTFCEYYGLRQVPVIGLHAAPATVGEILAFADGPSELNPWVGREGYVLVTDTDERRSIKVVSNSFLEGEK